MPASIQNYRKTQRVLVRANQNKLPTKLEIIKRPPGQYYWRGNCGCRWSKAMPTLGAAINELFCGRIVNYGNDR
jgi:hypothetical protein